MSRVFGFNKVTGNVDYEIGNITQFFLTDPAGINFGNYSNPLTNYITAVGYGPNGGSGVALVSDSFYLRRILLTRPVTVSKIGVEVTAGGAGSTTRIGLYNGDGPGGYPGSLFLDAGTIDSTSPAIRTINFIYTLYGAYWIAMITTGGTPPSVRNCTASSAAIAVLTTGKATLSNVEDIRALRVVSAPSYGSALPSSVLSETWDYATTSSMPFLQV
jgi:hypothetical protein